jgi:hypothetical protein
MTGAVVLAIQGSNGHLWFCPNGPFSGFDTGFSMKAGTSPAVAGRTASGSTIADVAFQSNNGLLYVYTNFGGTTGSVISTGIALAPGASPRIFGLPSGFQAWAKGSNGNLWVTLNGVSEDQGYTVN